MIDFVVNRDKWKYMYSFFLQICIVVIEALKHFLIKNRQQF